MAVRIRLRRVGSNKNPIWRIVVADRRSPRDGRTIETIGHYNPQTEPSTIVIDEERFRHWVSRGAQPTNTVKQLVKAHGKGIAGGISTGSAGVSRGGTAVAEEPAGEPAEIETPAEEPAEAETPPDDAAEARGDAE